MNENKTAKIITTVVVAILLIGGIFAWRYWGELKGLFSKADVRYDISLYPEGQPAPYPLFPCPQITNGSLSVDLTAFNTGSGGVTITGAAYHGVSPIGPAAGQSIDRSFTLTPNRVVTSGTSSSFTAVFNNIPQNTVTNLIELSYSSAGADFDSSPGNWPNSQEDDDIRFSCSAPPDDGGGGGGGGNNPFDLSIAKTASPTTLPVGQTTVFSITLLNETNTQTATNVTVRDTLPTTATYVSHTTSSGTFSPSTGIWSIPTVTGRASATLFITARINSAGTHTNIVQITASTPTDTNTSNNSASASVSTTGNPPGGDLVCTPSTQTVAINQDATFTVTNGSPAQSAWSAPGGTPASGTGASFTTKYATSGDKVVTVSYQNSTGQCRVTVTPGTPYPTPVPTIIDLSLSKSVSNQTPQVNSDIVYSVTVTNSGPAVATGVTVKDALPSGLTFKAASASTGSYTGSTWTVGTLNVGASANLLITARVDQTGTITNVAEVCSANQQDADSTPCNNVATEDDQGSATINPVIIPPYTTPVNNNADLSLSKSVSNTTPLVGTNVVYSINIYNSGPTSASNVTVRDVLPTGVSFVTSSATQGSYVNGSGIWTVGTLNVGASANLQITVTANQVGSITNTAEVCSSSQPDPDSTPCNNNSGEDDQGSATINPTIGTPTPSTADLSLTKSVSNSTPQVGNNVIYTITVFNSGPVTASNVTVRDNLPSGLTFVSASTQTGSYVQGTGIWTVGTLNVGGAATLNITATVNQTGTITNVAEVCSSSPTDPDSTPCNGVTTEDDYDSEAINPTTQTQQVADISLTKAASNDSPKVGEQFVYTVNVLNSGPAAATSVTVKDNLPQGLTYVSSQATQGSYDKNTGTWTIGSLGVGSTVALRITVKATRVDNIINIAEVCSSSPTDPDSTPCNGVTTEDDYGTVTVRSTPGSNLPPAGASNAASMWFGGAVVLAAFGVYFAGRSRKKRTTVGNVSVTSFEKFD